MELETWQQHVPWTAPPPPTPAQPLPHSLLLLLLPLLPTSAAAAKLGAANPAGRSQQGQDNTARLT